MKLVYVVAYIALMTGVYVVWKHIVHDVMPFEMRMFLGVAAGLFALIWYGRMLLVWALPKLTRSKRNLGQPAADDTATRYHIEG